MTHRINEKELYGAIERLNRNLEKYGKLKLAVQHANGYINLFNESGSEGLVMEILRLNCIIKYS